MENEVIDLEESLFWLNCLESNLLDADYAVCSDDEIHFKIAALRRVVERNDQLENALIELDGFRDAIGAIVGPVL